MEARKIILSVDMGTSSVKVALITVDGQVLGWESEPLELILTQDGGTEQSPQEWWQAFINASKRLLRKKSDVAKDVFAVCCSTQGEGTIAVDKQGQPLSNCILWMDMRGAKNLKR